MYSNIHSLSATEIMQQNDTKCYNFSSSLDPVDRNILILEIENPSITDDQLATKVGLCRTTINRRRNSEKIKLERERLYQLPQTEVRRLMFKAVTRLEGFLNHSNPKVALAAIALLMRMSEQQQFVPVGESVGKL